jgi:hypothetical protein
MIDQLLMEKLVKQYDRLLLLGQSMIGKTCLLFTLAYLLAESDESKRVLFICRRDRIEQRFPSRLGIDIESENNNENICCSLDDWSSVVLGRICMKYVSSSFELKRVMAGLHAFTPRPDAIFVDDIDSFFELAADFPHQHRQDGGNIEEINLAVAFIEDAIDFLNSTRGSKCHLFVSSRVSASNVNESISRLCRGNILLLRELNVSDLGAMSRHFNAPSTAAVTVAPSALRERGLYHVSGERYLFY